MIGFKNICLKTQTKFYKSLTIEQLPNFATGYIFKDEKIEYAYVTDKNSGIFTSKRIIMFTNSFFGQHVDVIPYKSISISNIIFRNNSVSLLIYINNSCSINLKFKNLDEAKKCQVKVLYAIICSKIIK